MKYLGAILLVAVVFTIMLEGTYSQQELVEVSFNIVATENAQPNIVENAIIQYTGISSVNLLPDQNRIEIAYDQARITVEELQHIILSLGYVSSPTVVKAGF